MNSIKSLLLFCFFLIVTFYSIHSFAQYTYKLDQTTRFEKMGADEGLSSMSVYCIHQDKYGFIWIGTQFGLNLYDGYDVKIFKANPTDPHSLLNDWITSIYEDDNGTMWFTTNLGLSKYERATQTFSTYLPDTLEFDNPINVPDMVLADGDFLWVDVWKNGLFRFNTKKEQFQSFAKDTVNLQNGIHGADADYIFMDGSGVLWVGSSESGGNYALNRFNEETETFKHFIYDPSDPESFCGKQVKSMIEDEEGTIWIATYGGGLLEITDIEKGKFRQYRHNESDPTSIIHNYLYKLFKDSKGNIWIGGTKGFSFLDKEIRRFTNYRIPNRTDFPNRSNRITYFYEDVKGDLYLSAKEGFFKFNPTTENLVYFRHDPEDSNSLSDNLIFQIIGDRAGQIWIVAPNSKINRINQFSNAFRRIQKKAHVKNSLSDDLSKRFYIDSKGNFWVGTLGGGLNRTKLGKDKAYNNFEHFVHNSDDPKSISDNRIQAIYEDRDQTLWFGTFWGLNKYDYRTNSFTNYQSDPNDSTTISSNTVESIYEDSHGTFWIGTRNGLNIMDKETAKFIRFLPDESDSNAIINRDTRVIYEDSDDDLWFGGESLEKFNRKDSTFVHYTPDPKDKSVVNRYLFWGIKEDDSTNLWLSSVYEGLYKVDKSNMTFTYLNDVLGLPSNTIKAIEIDNKGFIWVASNQGLSSIDPHDYSVRNFDVEDGLVSREFNNRGAYKDDEGWLYFGSMNGFNVFHPDSIKENRIIPPVYITALTISGQQKYFDKPLYETNEIELEYNENDLSLDFVALNFINPLKNQYAYMLEGYDKNWNYVGSRREAFYTNLSPGKYTFRVKASNNDGYWNEAGASLVVMIYPPFWQTWWAYVIYALVFLGLVYVVRRNELRKINLRQELELEQVNAEKLAELDIEKNKFFSNISHEFRTPLTLILGPLNRFIDKLKSEEQKQELGLVKRNALRLQTLVNQLLSLSKLESGKMKLKAHPKNIVKLTSLFVQSFHSMADDRGIKLDFESDAEECIVYIDPIKFEKVVNNLLSNAFKFTERGGEIKVAVSSKQYAVGKKLKANSPASPAGRQQLIADHQDQAIQITISDTGIGIQKQDLPHIFDRFYQVDETQMKTNLGTGIGLALTKELVELHHGIITAESEPGLGTSFTIQLPMGKEHLSEDEIFEPENVSSGEEDELLYDDYLFAGNLVAKTEFKNEGPGEGNGPRLLIVEDNEDMRTYLKSYLTDSFQIMEATNGKEGAEKAIEHIPDLIVSDLMMPKLDGNEMTLQLKTDERTSHIPIILLTAKASRESKLEGLETGADDFLTKPFDADELLVRVSNLINQRNRLREIFGKKLSFSVSPGQDQLKDSGITSMDVQFLKKAYETAEKEMADPEFGVQTFSEQMGLSRMQLHRKLKALLDQSTTEFIKTIRLNKAAILLKSKSATAAEIGYDVGFNSPTYFSSCFKEHFGISPSEYAKE